MSNDDRTMTPAESKDFLRETFFTPEAEMPPPTPAPLTMAAEIRALKKFVAVLERMPLAHRRATIGWLTDRYLDIRV